MKILTLSLILLWPTVSYNSVLAQKPKTLVHVDLSHGQRFWNDPLALAPNIGIGDTARIQYMMAELTSSLGPLDAQIAFLKRGINFKDIKKSALLILHVPATQYQADEVKSIQRYLDKGGNMLVVMEADYWTDNARTNVNEILQPYGITYGEQSADSLAGGYTKAGVITDRPLKVTYQFGRSLEGGTPFAFNSQTDEAFGVFKQNPSGGKLVVLGDAMSTLYMTEWRGVSDYQCQDFMQAIFKYLLKE